MRNRAEETFEDIFEIFTRYMGERESHIGQEEVNEDAVDFLRRNVRGHTMGSRKWTLKVEALRFWKHYRLRKSYVSGHFEVGKRDFAFKFSICSYLKTQRGTIYTLLHPEQHRLYLFSGHFFDRLTQRHTESAAETVQRELAVEEGLDFFIRGFEQTDRDPVLMDTDGQVYSMMDGGYAVGNYEKIRVDRYSFPKNESGELTICFFRTFLSDLEISPEKMERMLALYRLNGISESRLSKTS